MTTAAAIDRIVHHSIVVEMAGPSIRNEDALARNGAKEGITKNGTPNENSNGTDDNYQPNGDV